MPQLDRYGLPISTTSDAAAAAFRTGIDRLLATWQDTATPLDAALAADPDFALARAARARLHFSYAEIPEAKAAIARAVECATRNGTEREKSHVAIVSASINGQTAKALTAALAHLDQWPRDAVIMSMPLGAFGLFAFSGMPNHDQARVDLCARHAHHYGSDWWFRTYQGWSLIENGEVSRGRDLTEHAFAQRRENANAVHALAHAMFEDGSTDAADALINGWLPLYDRSALLYSHITWHRALGALERGDGNTALAIYEASIRPGTTGAAALNVVTDCASLLWRSNLAGHHVPSALWSEVSTFAETKYPTAGVTFADVHAAFAAAAANNITALDARLSAIEKRLGDGLVAAGPVVPALCRAMRAYAGCDYKTCVSSLEPVAGDVVRVGGSHAQREIFEDTLIVAMMKSGATEKAKVRLDARLHRRPSQQDQRWRQSLNN